MSETWLCPDISDSLIAIDNYFIIRNDQLQCGEGGVACYVDKSLIVSVLKVSNNESIEVPEYLVLEVCLPNEDRLFYASVYKRPTKHLLFEIFNILNNLSHRYKHIIIGGDKLQSRI